MATHDSPIRFRVVAGTVEHKGGAVLAVLTDDAGATISATFEHILDELSVYDTDEIKAALDAWKDDDLGHFADLVYDRFRALVNQKSTMGVVNVAYVLYALRRLLKVEADNRDTPYTFEGNGKHEP